MTVLETAVVDRKVRVSAVSAENFVTGAAEGAGDVPEGEGVSEAVDEESDGGARDGENHSPGVGRVRQGGPRVRRAVQSGVRVAKLRESPFDSRGRDMGRDCRKDGCGIILQGPVAVWSLEGIDFEFKLTRQQMMRTDQIAADVMEDLVQEEPRDGVVGIGLDTD